MEGSTPQASVPRNRYFVVAMLAGVYALSFLDRQLLSILAEPVKNDLGLSDTQLGLLTGLTFALFYTCFGIPVARLADRSNRVRIVAFACALWSVFTAGCGLAQSFAQLALARIGVGVGEAGGSPPSYSIISDYFPPEQRSGAFAIYSLGIPVGTTIGAAAGGWIAAAHGWRSAFFVIGLVGVVFAVLVLTTVREPKRGQLDAGPVVNVPLGVTLRAFVRDSVLRYTAIAGGLSAFVGYAMLSWMPALLMRTKGMTLGEVAIYYSLVSGVAAAAGTLLTGHLADRFGQRNRAAYALIPAAAFALAMPFFAGGIAAASWAMALVLMIVPFALYASYLAPAMAVVQNAVSPSQRSTASAVLQFFFSITGLGGGPLYVGMISDWAARAGYANSLQIGLFALVPIFLLAALAHVAASRALRRQPA